MVCSNKMGVDKENMKKVLEDFPDQIKSGWRLGKDISIVEPVNSIVVLGMGGSALSGDFLKDYLNLKIPVIVNKEYTLPSYINSRSFVFAISYSGNTEETIDSYKEAVKRKCKTIVITSGGKLLGLCGVNGTPFIKIPKGLQPRMSYGYIFFSLLRVLQNSHLIDKQDDKIERLVKVLKSGKFDNMGQELSEKLFNKIPLIYAGKLKSAAYKWKIDFNENTKIHAFCNYFSEFNHNEINGYINKNGDYYIIILRDDEEHSRIRKRMKIIKGLIKKQGYDSIEIVMRGDDDLTKLFSAVYIGDWTSYHLALKYETDPTPVKIVEDLKKQLGKKI